VKTAILLAFAIISLSGCSDFIGTEVNQEARASKPSPADISTKHNYDEVIVKGDTSKAAPTEPAK